MNNIERDKFLTEAMGECWHDICHYARTWPALYYCNKCNVNDPQQNDFSTWEGFGKLWEWAQKQRFWPAFVAYHGHKYSTLLIGIDIIKPNSFADAVYNFLKEKGV